MAEVASVDRSKVAAVEDLYVSVIEAVCVGVADSVSAGFGIGSGVLGMSVVKACGLWVTAGSSLKACAVEMSE